MYAEHTPRDRIAAALPALLVHALILLALLRAFGLPPAFVPPEVMQLVGVDTPPPPPIVQVRPPQRERARRHEGAAAPPNRESQRTELVAPPPVLPLPPVMPVAPVSGPGPDPTQGAALPGPGTGSGGLGTGTGAGRYGDGPGGGGDGEGWGDGGGTPPRRIRGEIRDRDYPDAAGEAGTSGTVSVIYTVEVDGRATNCRITESSGSRELDETTCRLIEQRFRFAPSRDRQGRPVRSRIVQDHEWAVEDEPEEPRPPPRRRRFGF